MRKDFVHTFGYVTHTKSAFLREMYKQLTGDCSASANLIESEVDARIKQIVDCEDPDLIYDLRANNKSEEKYQIFLEECQQYIDSQVQTAVDDRRHDMVDSDNTVITHLATAMSASDLHSAVRERCPENTPIPSLQWLRLQFWPRNASIRTAAQHNGKLKVKFMVQARQFRLSHIDAHYASVLFRYQREFSIQYREYVTFASLDDKHTIKLGEPGYPLAAAECGKQVLVSTKTKFEVGDHDFSKFSLTPSVCLMIEVPETIDGSFYRGNVFVGLKENSFEPSSPLRHMTELKQILYNQSDSNPILLLYTDGGPDHRLTYISVKLSLVALFLERDLDFLCAVRTPPHHSWKNPVERIMSIINIALQSVGMMRSKTQNYEEELKSCKTTAAIRELGSKYPGVKVEVLDAVEPAKVLLYDLIKRLKLKDKPFSTFFAVTEKDMDDLWENCRP